jgi:sugar lactone lactonase YvrE
LVILLLGATTLQAQTITDDFNSGNDTNWTHYALPDYGTPTYTFPADGSGGFAYRIQAPPTGTDPYGLRNARAGSLRMQAAYNNRFSVGVDLLTCNTTWDQYMGMVFKLQDIGLGTTAGYAAICSFISQMIYLESITNEASTFIGGQLVPLDPTHSYRLVVSTHDGSTYLFTAFDKSQPSSPLASAISSDHTYYGVAGPCGLMVFEENYPSAIEGGDATFDNYLSTAPAAGAMPATVTDLSPPPAGKATTLYPTVTVGILNRDTAVNTTSIQLWLDGVQIPYGSLTIDSNFVYKPQNAGVNQTNFNGATITYSNGTLYAWGSQHTNMVAFMDSTSTWQTNTWTWTTAYPYLFASNSLPIGSLSLPGFDTRLVVSYKPGDLTYANIANGGLINNISSAQAVLAVPSQYSLNLSSTNIAQLVAWDLTPPDIYGAVTNFPGLGTNQNSFAIQAAAYLQLTAGLHRFYVDSDDCVAIYSGTNVTDTTTVLFARFDGTVHHESFDFLVAADGLYPFNIIYEQGAGFAYLVLHSVNLADNSQTLLNAPGGIPAFYLPTPAMITAEPTNLTVCAGSPAIFSVDAVGGGLTYQWQVSRDGGNTFTNISDLATNASYTNLVTQLTDNSNQYRVVVTGMIGSPATSAPAVLTVYAAATASAGGNQTICSGNSTAGLGGVIGGGATGGVWTAVPGGGTFTPDPTTLNAAYNPSAADIAAGGVILTLTAQPCGDATAQVSVYINQTPRAPITQGATICGAGVANLQVYGLQQGVSLAWYSDVTLTNQVAEGPSWVTPILTNTTTYYVVPTLGAPYHTCVGPASPVTATVVAPATVSVGPPQSVYITNSLPQPGLTIRAWNQSGAPGCTCGGAIDGAQFDAVSPNPAPTASTAQGTIGYATQSINMPNVGPQEHFTATDRCGVAPPGPYPTGYSTNYCVEYRGLIYITVSNLYTFATASDDGSALWIDPATDNPTYSQAQVQNNYCQLLTTKGSSPTAMSAGYHVIIIRYNQGGGNNALQVFYDPTGGQGWEVIPGSLFYHSVTNGPPQPGLTIRAWNQSRAPGCTCDGAVDGAQFDAVSPNPAPTASTAQGTIGYATQSINMPNSGPHEHFTATDRCGVAPPGPYPTGYSTNYCVEYRGLIYIAVSNLYTFATASDDGSALWIDPATDNPTYSQAQVQNNNCQVLTTQYSSPIALAAGYHVIIIRYNQGGGNNALEVLYDPTGAHRWVVIPGSLFYHSPPTPTVTLAGSFGGGATGATWSGAGGFSPNNTAMNATYQPTAAEVAAGSATVTLTTTGEPAPCVNASATMTIPVYVAPTILVPPASQTVVFGSNVTFAVTVAGTLPLGYQWLFGGTNLAGATAASYSILGVRADDAGNYAVVVTNAYGANTSVVATLTVTCPAIALNPSTLPTATVGAAYSQSLSAAGGAAPYAFAVTVGSLPAGLNMTNGVLNGTPTGSGTNTFTVTATDTNGCPGSRSYTLTVLVPPTINAQPQSRVNVAGTTASFTVTATGTAPLSYQWLFNGTNLPTSGIITTVAGNGSAGFSGDGGAATNAGLYYPRGVALDAAGNLFIADVENSRVRKVDTSGIITTAAGNGGYGFSGDGDAATNASLAGPVGVAVDGAGNLFIADTGNDRIRKVDTSGIITTVAGNGSYGFSGDGGAATNAGLAYPVGVAVDGAGNLFIADVINSRARKVDTSGNITTVAGNGSSGFSGDGGAATNASLYNPVGVAVDAAGNLFIADGYNARIRKVETSGIIRTVAGNGGYGFSGDGGAATNASFAYPIGVAVDGAGNLFIADEYNARIRKVDPSGIITTVAGNGSYGFSGDGGAATSASFYYPFGVALDGADNLFIADYYNQRIRKVVGIPHSSPLLPTLIIDNVSSADAGNYAVIISNAAGSITSSVATLTVIVCASNKVVECGTAWDFDLPTATDNAGSPMVFVLSTVTNTGCGGTFTATRTWAAVDTFTNTATCSQTVTIVDTTPPTIVCPASEALEFQDETGASASYVVAASDTCSSVSLTVTPASGSRFAIGVTPVQALAVDACGNSNQCAFTVTVLGAWGVNSNVLAQLVALRSTTATNSNDYRELGEAVEDMIDALGLDVPQAPPWVQQAHCGQLCGHHHQPPKSPLWLDQTHVDRANGCRVFFNEQAAVRELLEIIRNPRSGIPHAVAQDLINRLVKCDRLLAVVSIQDAARAGANTNKIAKILRQVAEGDRDAAASQPTQAIGDYWNAWTQVGKLHLACIASTAGGEVQITFPGNAGHVYLIQASTNLVDWVSVSTCKADDEGNVRFTDSDRAGIPLRFYRAVEQ